MSNTSEDLIRSLQDALGRSVASRVERALSFALDDDIGWGKTFESPIEQMFFLGMCVEAVQLGHVVHFAPGVVSGRSKGLSIASSTCPVVTELTELVVASRYGVMLGAATPFPNAIVHLYSQVSYRDYRLDFLVDDEHGARVAIECDGHDYHERTKDQARRDRRRDRTLIKDGLPCLRFTGSELFSDAIGCAREVYDFLDERGGA